MSKQNPTISEIKAHRAAVTRRKMKKKPSRAIWDSLDAPVDKFVEAVRDGTYPPKK